MSWSIFNVVGFDDSRWLFVEVYKIIINNKFGE